MEKINEAYSLHRYVDENGAPDYEKIFSQGESKLWIRRHLDAGLIKIWFNQPEKIQRLVEKHLQKCSECRNKFNPTNPKQQDLPLNPE